MAQSPAPGSSLKLDTDQLYRYLTVGTSEAEPLV